MYIDYLWKPHRLEWITGKRKSGECIFCEIIKGNKRIPQKVVHKDSKAMVAMNMFPYNPGHLMVIPNRHVTFPHNLSEEEFSHFNRLVRQSILLLKKTMKPAGFNVGVNLGKKAGLSIPHLHYHIVPRFKSDSGFTEIIGDTKIMPQTIEETYRKLKPHLEILKQSKS